MPEVLDHLGLPQAELDRHIGIDIGILGVSERLSDLLDAPLVFQRYSRLVIEANRRLSAPDSITVLSDGTAVPANVGLDDVARKARVDEIFAPYHETILRVLYGGIARIGPLVLVSMHSFTPSLLTRPTWRPWEIGLCFGPRDAFTRHVLAVLDREEGLTVGRNEPYEVAVASSYSIPVYGEERGVPYAEFEIRQDLIGDTTGQTLWADRIARVLREAYRRFTAASPRR